MDVESQKAWELKNEGTEILKFDDLMTFPHNTLRSMEMLNDSIPPKQLHVKGRDDRSKQGFKHPCYDPVLGTQCSMSLLENQGPFSES